MKVTVPFSMEQELLVEEHLFNKKELYVAPDEHRKLRAWVSRHHSGHRVVGAEMDIAESRWVLELEAVTVTS